MANRVITVQEAGVVKLLCKRLDLMIDLPGERYQPKLQQEYEETLDRLISIARPVEVSFDLPKYMAIHNEWLKQINARLAEAREA